MTYETRLPAARRPGSAIGTRRTFVEQTCWLVYGT